MQQRTTPYHLMCTSLVVRFNAPLRHVFVVFVVSNPGRGIESSPICLQRGTTGVNTFSPFELLYMRITSGFMHILRKLWTIKIPGPDVKSSYEYVLKLRKRLDATLQIAREDLQKA
ncbi:hypothetical protein PoB_006331200 [Plakobranchus ocellatus]|uniref:Uncharacterized protein n=1 Tax=Plakobranchus ocellatus TaxID=259542 RepID=A0AAV4CY29_9GAST|nr:hypothetical protein PoB_006331200 [Plakobranchus ocellatus]